MPVVRFLLAIEREQTLPVIRTGLSGNIMRDLNLIAPKQAVQRNLGLDLVKIIATVAMIGLHTVATRYSRFNLIAYCFCGCAMPLFFMTNGYSTLNKVKIDFLYSMQKIRNILLITLFWNMIGIVFDYLKTKDFHRIPVNILGPYIQQGVMAQFWFFGTLILIYLALPLFKYIFDRPKLKWPFFMLLFLACSMMTVFSVIKHVPLMKPVPQTFRLWTWLFYYFLGGILKQYQEKITRFLNFKLHAVLLVVFTIGYVLYQDRFFANAIKSRLGEYTYDSIPIMLWVVALFLFILRLNIGKKPKFAGVIGFVSPLMFGCYIIHIPYMSLLVSKFAAYFKIVSCPFDFAMVLILSLIMIFLMRKVKFINKYLSY